LTATRFSFSLTVRVDNILNADVQCTCTRIAAMILAMEITFTTLDGSSEMQYYL